MNAIKLLPKQVEDDEELRRFITVDNHKAVKVGDLEEDLGIALGGAQA